MHHTIAEIHKRYNHAENGIQRLINKKRNLLITKIHNMEEAQRIYTSLEVLLKFIKVLRAEHTKKVSEASKK